MNNKCLTEENLYKSAEILPFPSAKRGRPPVKARRMAMAMLSNPNITQVGAATIAGVNQPKMNAWKVVRTDGFKEAYSSYQAHLNSELPFELKQAHSMYMRAYKKASNSAEMIKAIDGLCKLHGIEECKVFKRAEVTNRDEISQLTDSELKKLACPKGKV
jgi:hypothetical protein